ncbi:hypothetical protein WA026_000830 [Henosepilachna vigintioctopunctata]|uniref:Phosphatidate cytidylyltransferase n=1 Tax=Henosepilachna vigintioctopunctata TaxID=420089 RepID=A0AAW1V1Q2_9CUCU
MIEINGSCTPIFLFEYAEYNLIPGLTIKVLPFVFVSLYIAVFASLVAPFAGFFASGFKRALNVKDFSDTIPGHGGILDRFDCQFLMAFFVFVYMSTFVKNYKYKKLQEKIFNLSNDDQMVFYELLKLSLQERNIL